MLEGGEEGGSSKIRLLRLEEGIYSMIRLAGGEEERSIR